MNPHHGIFAATGPPGTLPERCVPPESQATRSARMAGKTSEFGRETWHWAGVRTRTGWG
jgi:hypothetical protein